MAFCNSCGATLTSGTNFCSKCGSANASVPGVASTPAARPVTAPPPSTGSSGALKIILIIVGIIVLIAILGMVTCGVVIHRIAKSAHVSDKGDVKVETPFGSMETSADPAKTAEELGVEIYPGARVQKNGTASVTFGSFHTVTAIFESSDSADKVCDFYRSKFPSANIATSDQNQCSIISGDKGNSTNITVQSSGDGSRFTIVKLSKKS